MSSEDISQEQSIAERLVNNGRIHWGGLISLLASGWFLWAAGLLSSFISGLWRLAAGGVAWVIESTFAVWALIPASQTWIVTRSFEIAGASLESEFGVFAFVMGVSLIIAWFVAMESVFAFFQGWWS